MAVFRAPKKDNFTIMTNFHFRETGMSLKAKGLLSLMLSLPDYWDYSFNGLVSICKESETAIKSTLNELKEFGYLTVTRVNNEDGRFEYIYDIHEEPLHEKPSAENPLMENPPMENPPMGEPPMENVTQLSTNILSTDKSSTKQSSTNKYIDEFKTLWAMYPNKQGKQRAQDSYLSARKKGTTYEEVKDGIERYDRYIKKEKIKKQYIKHGSTFFSQYAWQDEYEAAKVEDDFDWGGIL